MIGGDIYGNLGLFFWLLGLVFSIWEVVSNHRVERNSEFARKLKVELDHLRDDCNESKCPIANSEASLGNISERPATHE